MKNNICIIGGDSRQLYAAGYLAEKGYKVSSFACEHGKISEKTTCVNSLFEAMEADIIILPLPVSKNGSVLNTPLSSSEIKLKDISDMVKENHKIFYGMGNSSFIKQISAKTACHTDYFNIESLIYKNALLTSEGIISIILDRIPSTVFGMKTAITGYGRIGSLTAQKLIGLGADVSVFARNELQLLKAAVSRAEGFDISQLKERISCYDCVINTVPFQVIDKSVIEKSRNDCYFIETASAPYGIDADACVNLNRTLIKAFSLPGKTAPKSAGIIIGETIHSVLQEVK